MHRGLRRRQVRTGRREPHRLRLGGAVAVTRRRYAWHRRRGEPGFEELPTCFNRRATILGSSGPDQIEGTRGDDVIVTLAGDLRKEDRVCTGSGAEPSPTPPARSSWPTLGTGDDSLDLTGGSEVHGGPGDDRITVSDGTTWLFGGPGDDVMRVALVRRRAFGYNTTCVYYTRATGPMRVDLTRGRAHGEGDDRLVNVRCLQGGRFHNTIIGSPLGDDISLGRGDSEVWSGAGNDVVYNNIGDGEDIYHLGPGNDHAMSGAGADRVYGGSGNDFVEASSGGDYLDGGTGNDTLHASYRCDGGAGSGGAGTTDTWPNEVFGGPGDDYLGGDLGSDRLDGGPGNDRGQGGYDDGRIDWITSLEVSNRC